MAIRKASFDLHKNIITTKKVWKNILAISASFLLLFTSYNSMSFLQSTINEQAGTISLSILYLAMVISCLFLPTWLIKHLKEKKTMALCMFGYSVYIAAQFYPKVYILAPAAFILGTCSAPMWAAQCTYLTKIAKQYSAVSGVASEILVSRFFGVFFLFFQASYVIGNVISSTVLRISSHPVSENDTERLQFCGADYCPEQISDNFSLASEVSRNQRYIMSTIYLLLSIMSSFGVFLFVDPLIEDEENIEESNDSQVIATFLHLKRNPYQMLLIPLTFWSGLEQSFFGADFTAAYVGCGLGVYMVGYVLICYGVSDAIGSPVFSYLVRHVGRVPIFTFGAALNLVIIVIFMEWKPTPSQPYLYFILAAGWGLTDSIWQTQINALYGILFKDNSEAAFSNYRLWESLGFSLSYFTSTYICVETKLIALIVTLVVGIILYYVIELNERYKFMFKRTHLQ